MASSEAKDRPAADRAGIVGHGEVLDFLESSWKSGGLAHAYLLVGPSGSGKLAVARWLAETALGTGRLETSQDFVLVERGENPKTGKLQNAIVIDQIHGLRSRLSLGAMLGGWKAAIIDGADRLNEAAGNALLKTLEEPGPKTVIVLTADSLEAVLPTVVSRCQTVRLNRVPKGEIEAALLSRGADPVLAGLLSGLAAGCPGKALSLLSDRESLEEMRSCRERLMDIAESPLPERWQGLERLAPERSGFNESRDSLEGNLGLLTELLRDAVLLGHGLGERTVHVDVRERLALWPERFGLDVLNGALRAADAGRRSLKGNVSPKTVAGLVAASLSGL